MSLHTDRAFKKAQAKGAAAAVNSTTWNALMDMTKRELAEVSMHLAAVATGNYDEAISGGSFGVPSAFDRLMEEVCALRDNKLI